MRAYVDRGPPSLLAGTMMRVTSFMGIFGGYPMGSDRAFIAVHKNHTFSVLHILDPSRDVLIVLSVA